MTQFAIGPALVASVDVAGEQRASDAARLTSGNYVISGQGIFDPNGRPLSRDGGSGGSIAALQDGGFANAFVTTTTAGSEITLKLYEATGTPRTENIIVDAIPNGFASFAAPAVTTLTDGRIAVAWTEKGSLLPGPPYTFGKILNADGSAASNIIQLGPPGPDQSTTGYFDLDLTPLANGGFALARGRFDYAVTVSSQVGAAEVQLFDAYGQSTSDNIVLSRSPLDVAATTLPDGRIVVAYGSVFRVVGADGSLGASHDLSIGNPRESTRGPVELAALPDGNILLTYRESGNTVAGIYTPDGIKVGLTLKDIDYNIPVVLSQDKFVFVGTQFAHASNIDGKTLPYGSGSDILSRIVTATFSTSDPDGTPLVNDSFYYARNGDVAGANQDSDQHYHLYGWQEGRNPNALFSTDAYRFGNSDVREAKIDPLQHYHEYGWKEGRDPSAAFDTQFYLANNPDVRAAGVDPFEHYLQYGLAEGREISAAITQGSISHGSFDPGYYLLSNVDVAKAAAGVGGDNFAYAYQHYQANGWQEGRNPNAVFDIKGYLAAYGDVAAAKIDPLAHYDQYGWREGRDPSATFDTSNYLSANGDVAAAGIDPLKHFLEYGAIEGRLALGDGLIG